MNKTWRHYRAIIEKERKINLLPRGSPCKRRRHYARINLSCRHNHIVESIKESYVKGDIVFHLVYWLGLLLGKQWCAIFHMFDIKHADVKGFRRKPLKLNRERQVYIPTSGNRNSLFIRVKFDLVVPSRRAIHWIVCRANLVRIYAEAAISYVWVLPDYQAQHEFCTHISSMTIF